ncbi:hypothetical protein H0H92_005786 [Tricholoma furcatifolium]|nr:hypothetical protein H0H92_005786 [Tricholoma furcatifolium]
MAKSSDVILILVAILFPPAAVAMMSGCGCDLLVNICLTILGYIPGTIHAFWLIYKQMQAEERYGNGGFQYVGNGQYQPIQQGIIGQPQPQYYGATSTGP